ncbi:MAG: Spy/CpxP family protein refolding chaperone [Burkholderiales bacterium]
MRPVFKSLFVVGALACAGIVAFAQPMGMEGGHHPMMGALGPMGCEGGPGMRGRMDPAKMEAFIAKRAAEVKTKLKITPAQEAAWTAFTAAMKPPAPRAENRPDPAEMAKLPLPERLEKMRSLHTQHAAEMNAGMDARIAAVKTFYAVLSPEQQKVLDAEHNRLAAHREHRWGHGGAQEKPAAK